MDGTEDNRDPAGITALLQQIKQGDVAAESDLLPLIYNQLRVIARNQMGRERPANSLQATILVHEAFLQLVGNSQIDWKKPGTFLRSGVPCNAPYSGGSRTRRTRPEEARGQAEG